MFKVFNRCLTSRLTGHDQTKINVLQIFHAVINKVHVDYASLLWWDFIHCVQQKKNVIQYPRFTKLIIVDIMIKYESIPKRLEEDYHSIKDDTTLVNVYTIGKITVTGMLIPYNLLTDEIRDTQAYKDYEEKYGGVEVPMIQQEPVESTQGTHKTPRATRTPNPNDVVKKKKRKRTPAAGETSSPRKSLKIRFKQQKPVSTTPPPPSDDREREILEEDVEKIVKGEDEESYAIEFADMVLLDKEDSGTRIEPKIHKDKPKNINDDDNETKDDKQDDDDNDDDDYTEHVGPKLYHISLTHHRSNGRKEKEGRKKLREKKGSVWIAMCKPNVTNEQPSPLHYLIMIETTYTDDRELLSLGLGLGLYLCCRLVPLCCVIFDLVPFSLSFDFVFSSEIFKSFSLRSLSSLPFCDLMLVQRTSLTGFPTQSLRSYNADALDSSYLLILITKMSQSRQHDKSESVKSCKSPTAVLFDVNTGRISIRHCGMIKSITLNVLA
ncbi:hypothetical protein Tco_0317496 [Tanacetum coccineum]